MCFSINCPTVICLLTVCYVFEREASSENYGPRVYFNHIIKTKIPCCNLFTFILFCNLSIYLYKIWSLQVTSSRGLTTLLPALGASICFCVCRCCSLGFARFSFWFDKPWFSLREILVSTILHLPSSSGKIPTQLTSSRGRWPKPPCLSLTTWRRKDIFWTQVIYSSIKLKNHTKW